MGPIRERLGVVMNGDHLGPCLTLLADELDKTNLDLGPLLEGIGIEGQVTCIGRSLSELIQVVRRSEQTAVRGARTAVSYEHFTDRARKVMQLANQEARRLNHKYLGTEHILLGLIEEGSGVAANVLRNLGVNLRLMRLDIENIVQSGGLDVVKMGKLPQTPRAKKVIEYSMEEARNLGHDYVGDEHILLALLTGREGVARNVLDSAGVTYERVREETLRVLGGEKKAEAVEPMFVLGDRKVWITGLPQKELAVDEDMAVEVVYFAGEGYCASFSGWRCIEASGDTVDEACRNLAGLIGAKYLAYLSVGDAALEPGALSDLNDLRNYISKAGEET